MTSRFDLAPERRGSDSLKWSRYEDDVLPLWVADMDFAAPEPILQALRERVGQGVFGYGTPPRLAEVICERLASRYAWQVLPEQILFLPGLVSGLNVVCRAVGEPGDQVLVQTPVYPPFLTAPGHQERHLSAVELAPARRGGHLYYEMDFERLAAAITGRTRLLLLCHPHNPVGRVYRPEELLRLAELCARHDLLICSDEIHCELVLGGGRHRPLASLGPELAGRCITLMAPSKTFNMPGLGIGFAVVPNPDWLRRLQAAAAGIVPGIDVLAFTAALAAYSHCDDWLAALLRYLTANRDYLLDYAAQHLPGIRATCPEATYLAWLDCREAGIPGNPQAFFLREGRVAFNDGVTFGPGGEGFVRLNFGCPRATLIQALERVKAALSRLA